MIAAQSAAAVPPPPPGVVILTDSRQRPVGYNRAFKVAGPGSSVNMLSKFFLCARGIAGMQWSDTQMFALLGIEEFQNRETILQNMKSSFQECNTLVIDAGVNDVINEFTPIWVSDPSASADLISRRITQYLDDGLKLLVSLCVGLRVIIFAPALVDYCRKNPPRRTKEQTDFTNYVIPLWIGALQKLAATFENLSVVTETVAKKLLGDDGLHYSSQGVFALVEIMKRRLSSLRVEVFASSNGFRPYSDDHHNFIIDSKTLNGFVKTVFDRDQAREYVVASSPHEPAITCGRSDLESAAEAELHDIACDDLAAIDACHKYQHPLTVTLGPRGKVPITVYLPMQQSHTIRPAEDGLIGHQFLNAFCDVMMDGCCSMYQPMKSSPILIHDRSCTRPKFVDFANAASYVVQQSASLMKQFKMHVSDSPVSLNGNAASAKAWNNFARQCLHQYLEHGKLSVCASYAPRLLATMYQVKYQLIRFNSGGTVSYDVITPFEVEKGAVLLTRDVNVDLRVHPHRKLIFDATTGRYATAQPTNPNIDKICEVFGHRNELVSQPLSALLARQHRVPIPAGWSVVTEGASASAAAEILCAIVPADKSPNVATPSACTKTSSSITPVGNTDRHNVDGPSGIVPAGTSSSNADASLQKSGRLAKHRRSSQGTKRLHSPSGSRSRKRSSVSSNEPHGERQTRRKSRSRSNESGSSGDDHSLHTHRKHRSRRSRGRQNSSGNYRAYDDRGEYSSGESDDEHTLAHPSHKQFKQGGHRAITGKKMIRTIPNNDAKVAEKFLALNMPDVPAVYNCPHDESYRLLVPFQDYLLATHKPKNTVNHAKKLHDAAKLQCVQCIRFCVAERIVVTEERTFSDAALRFLLGDNVDIVPNFSELGIVYGAVQQALQRAGLEDKFNAAANDTARGHFKLRISSDIECVFPWKHKVVKNELYVQKRYYKLSVNAIRTLNRLSLEQWGQRYCAYRFARWIFKLPQDLFRRGDPGNVLFMEGLEFDASALILQCMNDQHGESGKAWATHFLYCIGKTVEDVENLVNVS